MGGRSLPIAKKPGWSSNCCRRKPPISSSAFLAARWRATLSSGPRGGFRWMLRRLRLPLRFGAPCALADSDSTRPDCVARLRGLAQAVQHFVNAAPPGPRASSVIDNVALHLWSAVLLPIAELQCVRIVPCSLLPLLPFSRRHAKVVVGVLPIVLVQYAFSE
jgi:hypothetical protein